ncbi:MAG: hypothetical protein LQ342_006804 [Letrouitia transgressa]|nr:MAG: hypothetical protein LQ342_006804 [Letrouitia transgressa]
MLSTIGSAVLLALPSLVIANTLPIFSVQNSFRDPSRARELIKNLYQNSGQPTYLGSRLVINAPDNSSTVEIDTLSGGIWSADNTRLWNVSHAKRPKAFEKAKGKAKSFADDLIKQHGLLPVAQKDSPFSFDYVGTSSTQVSREDGHLKGKDFTREEFQLDVSANYRAQLTLPGRGKVPIVGGGGKFQFTFEDSGRLIGHHGVWREVQGSGTEYPVISQKESDKQFAAATRNLTILNFNSSLAYYAAPTGEVQNHLYPVYVYHATAKFGNRTVDLRETILPASTFGTELKDLNLKPDCSAPQEKKPKVNQNTSSGNEKRASKRKAKRNSNSLDSWELGTEWLGKPWGLSQTQANAAGVRMLLFDWLFGLFGGGKKWVSNFDWGDYLVWESDWNKYDDNWVDAVDLMFYTGHASGDGWVTSDGFVDHSIVGSSPEDPGDLWGQLDMEWLVVAACGPHQDDSIVAGGGNVFDRWRGVFDGLHLFLGYATVTADTSGEGSRLVKYATQGSTLIDSWFRTAKEVQNSDVYVTAMWIGDSKNDHLPGHGSMSTDQPPTASRWIMWSKC